MGSQSGNPLSVLILPLIIFGIFYVVMFMPMRKRQKKHQEMLSKIAKGDRVVTTGGIYGTVVSVDGDVVMLRVAENVKLQVARAAIAGMASDAANVNLAPGE